MATTSLYRHALTTAVVWDRSSEGRVWVSGSDRMSWLQGLLTNDVTALGPGRGCYSCYLTAQGRMISDMRLIELGDCMLVDVPAGTAGAIVGRLEPFIITEDVSLVDATESTARLSVHGPSAAVALERVCAARGIEWSRPLASLQPNEAIRATVEVEAWAVAGARDLRLTGLDAYLPPRLVAPVLGELAGLGVLRGESRTFEMLRIEAGIPKFGIDMDETTIPLEAGLEAEAISFTKGCYVGQEVVVRILHRGQGRVARRLVGLTLDAQPSDGEGDASALAGAVLLLEGVEVGRLTSATYSEGLGRTIALGYVARALSEPGIELTLAPPNATPRSALVTSLPFVAHD